MGIGSPSTPDPKKEIRKQARARNQSSLFAAMRLQNTGIVQLRRPDPPKPNTGDKGK